MVHIILFSIAYNDLPLLRLVIQVIYEVLELLVSCK